MGIPFRQVQGQSCGDGPLPYPMGVSHGYRRPVWHGGANRKKLDLLVISVTRHDEKIRFASWLSGAAFLAALGVIAGVAKQWLSP